MNSQHLSEVDTSNILKFETAKMQLPEDMTFVKLGHDEVPCVTDITTTFVHIGTAVTGPGALLCHLNKINGGMRIPESLLSSPGTPASELRFPSAMHAYTCARWIHEDDWHLFSIDGEYGDFERGMLALEFIMGGDMRTARNRQRWAADGSRYSRCKIGNLAQVAKKNLEKLSIAYSDWAYRMVGTEEELQVWEDCICEWMSGDHQVAACLISTHGRHLVELNCLTETAVRQGRAVSYLWNGSISKTDGKLYGCNLMGTVWMRVRERIRRNASSALQAAAASIVWDKPTKKRVRKS
jgi:hypothetical protein